MIKSIRKAGRGTSLARTAVLLLAFAALAAASGRPEILKQQPPAGKARGPWSDAQVGTRLEMRDFEPNYLRDLVGRTVYEVVAADAQSVTIRANASVNDKPKPEQKIVLPRFVAPGDLKKLTDAWGPKTGRRTLSIKGRDVVCDLYEKTERRTDPEGVATRSTFISEDVPSWVVRVSDVASSEGRTVGPTVRHEVLDFTWGPDAPAPVKTDPPAKAPDAPKPAPEVRAAAPAKSDPAAMADVPKTPENRKLAADVMGRLVHSYFSLLETDATGFDATYAVRRNGADAGTVRCAWSSEAGETTAQFKGALGAEDAGWLETLAKLGLLQTVFTEGDNPQMFALAAEDGFVFSDYAAVNAAVLARRALLSADLTRTGEILRLSNGVVRRIDRQAQKSGDRFYVMSARIVIWAADGSGRTVDFVPAYALKGGLPFVDRLAISDAGADGAKTAWDLRLDAVSFTRPAK